MPRALSHWPSIAFSSPLQFLYLHFVPTLSQIWLLFSPYLVYTCSIISHFISSVLPLILILTTPGLLLSLAFFTNPIHLFLGSPRLVILSTHGITVPGLQMHISSKINSYFPWKLSLCGSASADSPRVTVQHSPWKSYILGDAKTLRADLVWGTSLWQNFSNNF